MENMTLLIDPDTRDLVLDDEGHFAKIFDRDTTVQNVRHALLTWKAEFLADAVHGTDYERILGVNQTTWTRKKSRKSCGRPSFRSRTFPALIR